MVVGIRPEYLELSTSDGAGALAGTVAIVENLGTASPEVAAGPVAVAEPVALHVLADIGTPFTVPTWPGRGHQRTTQPAR